ncbi:MAG TPA: hypothetical protein VE398_10720 [Acidobacteriota bacterium]|nr:hypothetical protein [Acidobacteriota bacterium]
MNRTPAFLILLLLFATELQAADMREFTFDRTQALSEWKIPLAEITPAIPADWPDGSFLVLEMKASSSQRFDLRVYASEGYSRLLLQPYPGVWIRAAVPVAMIAHPPSTGVDMAAVGNRSRPGYFLGLWGPFRPMRGVQSIAFAMEHPVGAPRLEMRSIRLTNESPGDAVLDPGPVVDEFGQCIRESWPGKGVDLATLRKEWEKDDLKPTGTDFGYCAYGGYASAGTKHRATGFFRCEKIEGRWWFIDPDGHLFLSVGSDVMTPWMETRTEGRTSLFRSMPPADLLPPRRGQREAGASFYTWNLFRRYGTDWLPKWVDHTLQRMEAWGLNTVANWSHNALWESKKKAYAVQLGRWETAVNYLGLPDVYSDEFPRNVDESARRQCAGHKDDPWLLGYFLANEPPFPQKEQQTIQLILSGSDTGTQRELKRWLAGGDTPERRKEFVDRALDRYIQVTSEAVRKYDPNHLNLGMRSGGRPTDAEIRSARAFDVYSVNIYDYEVRAERARRIAELTGKPVLIGEFHFGTPGRGLAASLVLVRDQAARGTAYRFYVENAFSMPEMIGTHWFQWVDQPCTGRFDGEDYNIGLVDVTDRPYTELIEALKATHLRLYQVHTGLEKPFSKRASPN